VLNECRWGDEKTGEAGRLDEGKMGRRKQLVENENQNSRKKYEIGKIRSCLKHIEGTKEQVMLSCDKY